MLSQKFKYVEFLVEWQHICKQIMLLKQMSFLQLSSPQDFTNLSNQLELDFLRWKYIYILHNFSIQSRMMKLRQKKKLKIPWLL